MKKLFLILSVLLFQLNVYTQTYCTSVADTISADFNDITRVTLSSPNANLNNSTTCADLVGSQGQAQGKAGCYSDFTQDSLIPIPNLKMNNTYQLSVKINGCATNTSGMRIAYIDYNHDGDFVDPNEKIIIDSMFSTDSIKTVTFIVPSGAYNGLTRMRIVYRMMTSLSMLSSCGLETFKGETEDYLVNIVNCNLTQVTIIPGTSNYLTAMINPSNPTATYVWKKNGVIISGQTSSSIGYNSSDSGLYCVVVNTSNGCEYSACYQLNSNKSTPNCTDYKTINYTKNGSTFVFNSSGAALLTPYVVKYNWTFSNGTTSTQKNPSVTFGVGSNHWAKLVVCIDSANINICCDSSIKDNIKNCQMACSITKSGDTFSAVVTGGVPPYTYQWSNGKTTKSMVSSAAGTYYVIITDSNGCTTDCNFFTQGNPCKDYKNFYYSSSAKNFYFYSNIPAYYNPTYHWSFGDTGVNSTSIIANPYHSYATTGTFLVTFKYCLRDSTNKIICCDSVSKNVISNIQLPCNVKANFKWTYSTNGGVQFTDSTTPLTSQTYTYYWTFGDGTSSTQKNPFKIYSTNGSKTVCLIARRWLNNNNMYCEDSICKTISVSNANPCNRLEPKFTWSSTAGVYSFTNTTNMTNFNLVSINYVINNTNTTYTVANPNHTFTTNGTYSVTMTVTVYDVLTGTNCTKSITKSFYVNTSVCGCFKAYNSFTRNGMMINFNNLSQCVDSNTQYLYKFGNGDTSNSPSPSYVYYLPGLYRTVMYITKTVNGVTCKDSFVRIVQLTTTNPCKDSGYTTYITQPCPSYISPVCGCDSITYDNYCKAMRAGLKKYTNGPCPNDTNYVKICGYVYRDINKNCQKDTFDQPLSQITIKFNTNPITYAYTNGNGYYQIYLPKGTYQISQLLTFINPPINQLCPAANTPITLAATTGGATYCQNNFYDTTSLCPDLAVNIYRTATITPGFISKKMIKYFNRGATPITNVVLKYRFLSNLSVLSSTTPTYSVSGNIITWQLGTLAPYSQGTKYVNLYTPTSLPLGTSVIDSVWIEPIGGDCSQGNNIATFNDTCVGSYDPNDKSAYPANDIEPSVTSLDYIVRFQNTGTAPAHNVMIEDVIDANFEKSSLKITDYSHPMNHFLQDDGKVYFEFKDIMLPDSGTDYEASQGYVSYSINLKNNLPIGTQLKNTAAIYFDFNDPIITNTTINTIILKSSSGVAQVVEGKLISLYPNPANYQATFEMDVDKSSLVSYMLFDIQGKLVLEKSIPNQIGKIRESIKLDAVPSGIYLLHIDVNGKTSTFKLVKD